MKICSDFNEYKTAKDKLEGVPGYVAPKGIFEKYKNITNEVLEQYETGVLAMHNKKSLLENCQNAVKEQRNLLITNAVITAIVAIPIILIVLLNLTIAITAALLVGIPFTVVMLASKGFRGKVLEIVNKIKDYVAKVILTNYVFPAKKISKVNERIERVKLTDQRT